LKELKTKGCRLVGHPQYYRQFGFENAEGLSHDGVPQEAVFVLSFNAAIPKDRIVFHGLDHNFGHFVLIFSEPEKQRLNYKRLIVP
jgi:predicted N-acetyltransferase YhbS